MKLGITMLFTLRYRIRHWIPMFIGTPCITSLWFPATLEDVLKFDGYCCKFHSLQKTWSLEFEYALSSQEILILKLMIFFSENWSSEVCYLRGLCSFRSNFERIYYISSGIQYLISGIPYFTSGKPSGFFQFTIFYLRYTIVYFRYTMFYFR